MICIYCKVAADAGVSHDVGLDVPGYSGCPGGTWCDCQCKEPPPPTPVPDRPLDEQVSDDSAA